MSAAPVRAAVNAKKLRLYWDVPALPAGLDQDAVLAALWQVLRGHRPEPPGTSQDERLDVLTVEAVAGGGARVVFHYVFDRDFAAMYDQTEAYDGEVELSPRGDVVATIAWRAAT